VPEPQLKEAAGGPHAARRERESAERRKPQGTAEGRRCMDATLIEI
jgi:hypothetical protein